MRTNALGAALRLLLAGITDQLDMLVGLLAVQGVKRLGGQFERLSKGAQQRHRHLGHRPLPLQQHRTQGGKRLRPEIWPLKLKPARVVLAQ